jgi:glycerol uptake facilitator-like aquaporin
MGPASLPRIDATLLRRAAAELIGTALLLLAVVGSGIAAQRLSPNATGLELLENALVTGAALVAIVFALGPLSGAHLNPVVTCVDAALGGVRSAEAIAYIAAQLAGAVLGAIAANVMFGLAPVAISTHSRGGGQRGFSEVVATFGLVLVIFAIPRQRRATVVPIAVGAYITGAYFFTSSTSFANPAVTVARMLSNTFAGIAPGSVALFVLAQCAGGIAAYATVRALFPHARERADDVVVPHPDGETDTT